MQHLIYVFFIVRHVCHALLISFVLRSFFFINLVGGGVVDASLFRTCHTQDEATALIAASDAGHTECVRVLVEAGANLDAADRVRATVS